MDYDDAGTSPAGEGRRSASPDLETTAPATPPVTAPVTAPGPRRSTAVLAAAGAGVAAGILGTLLHGHVLYAGGGAVPVGAFGALVLAGCLFLLCGLWARNVILTAVAGAIAYGVVALLSTSSKTLILTGSSEAAPAQALAGNLWLFGVLVVTLGAVTLGAVLLRPPRRR